MSFDTAYYYRLTNQYSRPDLSLDVERDETSRLLMSVTGNFYGQFWQLVELAADKYALRTRLLGNDFSLDVVNTGNRDKLWLAPTGHFSGQAWTLTPWGDGTYKLTNDFTGPDRSLRVKAGTGEPFLDTGNHAGQHWTLTRLNEISPYTPIPELDAQGQTKANEGRTDFTLFARPAGRVKAVMIFVDFPNAHAGSTAAANVATHLLGNGSAQQLFHDQSYGKLTLEVTVRADLGWRRMSKNSSAYSFRQFASHRDYIAEAASLFSPEEVNFSEYRFVFIVAPEGARFPASPAFIAEKDDGASSPSGEIKWAVTFGTDSYGNRYINLVHEVGHLFGLPDLYPVSDGNADNSAMGCWPIMSDIFRSINFHGWHRHKNGWLDASRKAYISQNISAWQTTLSLLSEDAGLAMIVFPLDDVEHPTQVIVIELAQPVLGSDGQYWGEGVLLYTVDARIATGESPARIVPKTISHSDRYGYLYQAFYETNDTKTYTCGAASLTLTVLQKVGSSYHIEIDYHRN